MRIPSRYERGEIAVLLGSAPSAPPPATDGLVVGPDSPDFEVPALRKNGLNAAAPVRVLDTTSPLERISREFVLGEDRDH